jgi:hypothetical protein
MKWELPQFLLMFLEARTRRVASKRIRGKVSMMRRFEQL